MIIDLSKKNGKLSRVGIIGDTHVPYEHKGYLQHCQEQFDAWEVDTIIHIGDLIDNHALSFHDSEPMLKNVTGEYEEAMVRLEAWYTAFPNVTMCGGNHDMIPARQLKKIGMEPSIFMKPIEEIYGMPKGWSVVDEVVIDDILYHHGYTACGVNGFRADSQKRMQSTVTGHAHGNAGVSYTATKRARIFGLAVGCGVDNESMAFAYGKNFAAKPMISCGIVINKVPYLEPMDLGGL